MATAFYLNLKANGQEVQGESQESQLAGWIEVLAFEYAGNRGSSGAAGRGRMAHVSMNNFVIRKRVDRASPLLLKAFCQNETIEAKLLLRKSGGGGGGEAGSYMEIELKNATIAGLKAGNLAFGGETAEEEIELSYQTIRLSYNVQDDLTGIVRGGIEFEHQIMGAA